MHLIGWENGTSFLDQSQSEVNQYECSSQLLSMVNWKLLYSRCTLIIVTLSCHVDHDVIFVYSILDGFFLLEIFKRLQSGKTPPFHEGFPTKLHLLVHLTRMFFARLTLNYCEHSLSIYIRDVFGIATCIQRHFLLWDGLSRDQEVLFPVTVWRWCCTLFL